MKQSIYFFQAAIFAVINNGLFQILSRFIPRRIRRFVWNNIEVFLVSRYPDRIWLSHFMRSYPQSSGRVLFVGCRRYNSTELEILKTLGSSITVIDIDPYVEKFARSVDFKVLSLTELNTLYRNEFDFIICNGVFGDGLNERGVQIAALTAIHDALKDSGSVLVGLNSDGHPCYSKSANDLIDASRGPCLAVFPTGQHRYFLISQQQLSFQLTGQTE